MKPEHLKQKPTFPKELFLTSSILQKMHLSTVCASALCPNRFLCFSKKRATFLALGNICTRRCRFCNIGSLKKPQNPDKKEITNIAKAASLLKLSHIVITMVSRDDLLDGGAGHIAQILQKIKESCPDCTQEVLTSDFAGNINALDIVLEKKPTIFNHNIETTRSLTPLYRNKANYDTSLSILKRASDSKKCLAIKSGLMVGLSEKKEEVKKTIKDLCQSGCSIITIGQYLQPSKRQIPVKEYVSLKRFKEYEEYALSLGIKAVYSHPLVRSSFSAKEQMEAVKTQKKTKKKP